MSSLPPVEEISEKARVWNGFVCPGCRTVFRVAADFDGREVICPSCQECLKLPEKRHEAPPLVEPRPAAPVTAPPPANVTAPELIETVPAGPPQRLKLAFALIVPLIAALALVLVLSGDKDGGKNATASTETAAPAETIETPAPASVTDEPDPTESVPEITAISPPALPERLEILEAIPPAAPSEDPPVALAPDPPPAAEAPPLPDPEEGLVAAVPDTPGAVLPPRPVDSGEYLAHVVRSGETLGTIARRHDVTVDEIMRANRMRSDLLHAGQTLHVPVHSDPADEESPAATSEPEAHEIAENTTPGKNPEPAEKPASPDPPEPIKHTVVRGDNLTRLARQYGCEPADIMRLNGLKNSVIRLGEELLIPPPAN